ncbi:hypothetical protein [Geodermatophilus sp. SYSU D01119]
MLPVLTRARDRARRELVGRVPAARSLAHRRWQRRLRRHEPLLPSLPPAHASLVTTLREQGVAITTLDGLGLPRTAELRAGLTRLADGLARRPADGDTVRPPLEAVLSCPEVWQWGLAPEVLDLVESHLGLPARYHGADVRREVATGRTVGVRQWHRDIEDHRVFKVLVWLDDVDLDTGPFEYVPRDATRRLTRELRYVTGFVGDDDVRAHVPESEWRQATGPRWTAVVADTRAVFHRAMPPRRRDRYSVTFTWTSRTPTSTIPVPPVEEPLRSLAWRGLDERQRRTLAPAYAR